MSARTRAKHSIPRSSGLMLRSDLLEERCALRYFILARRRFLTSVRPQADMFLVAMAKLIKNLHEAGNLGAKLEPVRNGFHTRREQKSLDDLTTPAYAVNIRVVVYGLVSCKCVPSRNL